MKTESNKTNHAEIRNITHIIEDMYGYTDTVLNVTVPVENEATELYNRQCTDLETKLVELIKFLIK